MSPTPGESHFARLRAVLDLDRAEYTGFLKLTATLYAAFLVCLIGSLMPLGSEHAVTLTDMLHVAGCGSLGGRRNRREPDPWREDPAWAECDRKNLEVQVGSAPKPAVRVATACARKPMSC